MGALRATASVRFLNERILVGPVGGIGTLKLHIVQGQHVSR